MAIKPGLKRRRCKCGAMAWMQKHETCCYECRLKNHNDAVRAVKRVKELRGTLPTPGQPGSCPITAQQGRPAK